MANNKFAVKKGLLTPNVDFLSPNGTKIISATMLDSGTLSYSGTSGQLFSVTDNMTGVIFAVNDISGVPSIEVKDDGTIRFAELFGNVGIGTATPGAKLDINGSARIANASSLLWFNYNSTTNGPSITGNNDSLTVESGPVGSGRGALTLTGHNNTTLQTDAGFLSLTASQAGTTEAHIKFTTVSTERMRITSAGDIGIGTGTPGTKLQVEGSIRFATDGAGANYLQFQRNSGNNWKLTSDGIGDIATIAGNSITLLQDTTIQRGGLTVSPTLASAQTAINITQTWNSGATVFTLLKGNATDTASDVSSLLMDLQVGGASRAKISKVGELTLSASTASTTTGTGTLVVGGGVGIGGAVNIGGAVIIGGNLTVNGTTTTINTTTTTLDDPIITLGGDTAPTVDDNKDRGIEFRYFDTAARLGFFGYDDSTSKFTLLTNATNSSEVFSGTKGELDASVDWSNILSKPTLPVKASSTVLGLVELFSDTVQTEAAQAVTTTASRTYGVQLNSADQMVVNVPWADTNTTYAKATATTLGLIELADNTVQSVAANAVTTTASRTYGIQLNGNDQAVVNVPWTAANNGTLTAAAGTTGATNTNIALNFSTTYSADTATNTTINPVVGPALVNLATLMTTATAGFIRRTGQDTYAVDSSTYLTSYTETDTLASVTGRGATTATAISLTNTTQSTSISTGALIISGGVGIAKSVYVGETLYAASKSFLIPHPTKEGKKLRYGSLEGPENGVYIRGKLKDNNTIELPEYWTKLVDPDSITVSLTPIGNHQNLYVEFIENNKVVVANSNLINKNINCFFVVYGERIDIDKLVVEL